MGELQQRVNALVVADPSIGVKQLVKQLRDAGVIECDAKAVRMCLNAAKDAHLQADAAHGPPVPAVGVPAPTEAQLTAAFVALDKLGLSTSGQKLARIREEDQERAFVLGVPVVAKKDRTNKKASAPKKERKKSNLDVKLEPVGDPVVCLVSTLEVADEKINSAAPEMGLDKPGNGCMTHLFNLRSSAEACTYLQREETPSRSVFMAFGKEHEIMAIPTKVWLKTQAEAVELGGYLALHGPIEDGGFTLTIFTSQELNPHAAEFVPGAKQHEMSAVVHAVGGREEETVETP